MCVLVQLIFWDFFNCSFIRNIITIKTTVFYLNIFRNFENYSFDSKLKFQQPLLQSSVSSETCLIIIIIIIIIFFFFFICVAAYVQSSFWVDIKNLIEWPFQQNFVYALFVNDHI